MKNAYHRVGFTRTSLSIRKQATVVALPSVVQNLPAQRIVHTSLVPVLLVLFDRDAIFIDIETIMRPKGVVEREGSLLLCDWVHQDCLGPVLRNLASVKLTYHPDTAPASLFSLVEWTHAHCDFHTHPFFKFN